MAVAKRPWTSRSRDCHQRVSRIEMRRTDVDSSTENRPPRKKPHTNVLISHSHWPYEEVVRIAFTGKELGLRKAEQLTQVHDNVRA